MADGISFAIVLLLVGRSEAAAICDANSCFSYNVSSGQIPADVSSEHARERKAATKVNYYPASFAIRFAITLQLFFAIILLQ